MKATTCTKAKAKNTKAAADMLTDPQIAIVMLGLFIFMVLLGFPIAFTLIAMGLAFGYYAYYDPMRMQTIFDNRIFDLMVQNTFSVMSNDVLVAVPLFLFMGYVVERANIVNRLFFSLQLIARHLPGSMAVAALATCAIFATATGIIGAVVTLMGMLALPAMLKAGYEHKFASGVICAGGCLGILIPPSIMLIVYAVIAELSPLRLYAAAIFPGFLLAGMYMVYVIGRAWMNPALAPKPKEEDVPPFGQIVLQVFTSIIPLAVLIMAVLGCILLGLATPAEAAGVGAMGGLVLAVIYRSLTWERLKESVFLTAKTAAMVCWLFVGSWTFASVFSYLGGEHLIADLITGMDLGTVGFLILAQILIFLLGWPLEWTEILIIFVPIFLPLLEVFDVNPYFFAMLIALNLQTSFLTPPMAMSAYYLKGVAPPFIQLQQIFLGIMPYLAIVILCMVIMYIFPQLALFLPDFFFGAIPS
jgi:tripartite ATP-independent transporter DctM subunit